MPYGDRVRSKYSDILSYFQIFYQKKTINGNRSRHPGKDKKKAELFS